jgi:V8-like Glu-specific endopeptidase
MSYSTSTYPYDCVCYITATIGGVTWQASGAIIGPHTVLTASHALWHLGQPATSAQVSPGYSGGGSAISGPEIWHFNEIAETLNMSGETDISASASQQDFAVIDFAANLSS